jgi:L-2-hydroxyglutarate oxidase LhgO
MDSVETVVIGAGVLGLAVARALALRGQEVLILEKCDAIGTVTSSRNSEVIHAGIYYPKDSSKARLCVSGRDLLYRYCAERHLPHRRCGKLIVATSRDQVDTLLDLKTRAAGNGVTDLVQLDAGRACDLEPALQCEAALLSPSTGIIDAHSLMLAYLGDAENAGALLALLTEVTGGRITDKGIELQVNGEDTPALCATTVINCGGLQADRVAGCLQGLPPAQVPTHQFAKGNYFSLGAKSPFQRLIYPVPEPGGLGVHLTLDLAGRARFGPDVEWIDELDYQVNPRRADAFYGEVRRYWPDLPDESLYPDYSGVRPKLHGKGHPAADFSIQGPADHGIPGLVNLYGMESPGLTASLAIADHVCALLSRP